MVTTPLHRAPHLKFLGTAVLDEAAETRDSLKMKIGIPRVLRIGLSRRTTAIYPALHSKSTLSFLFV